MRPSERSSLRVRDRRHEAVEISGAVVAVDVAAVEGRKRAVADDVAAGDGAGAPVVAVFEDRRDRVRGGLVLVEAVGSLKGRPAEVGPLGLALLPVVDLLEGVLADVADRDRAGLGVEAEAPRISQPVGVDLRPGARGPVDERVVWRDGVGRAAAPGGRPDAEQLAEQRVEVLARSARIVLLAPVARADVEVAVRAELELAAVVVFGEVGHVQDLAGAALVEGAVRADRVADHVLVLVGAGEVGVDEVGALEVRREGDREEPLLVVVGHLVADVEGRVEST